MNQIRSTLIEIFCKMLREKMNYLKDLNVKELLKVGKLITKLCFCKFYQQNISSKATWLSSYINIANLF